MSLKAKLKKQRNLEKEDGCQDETEQFLFDKVKSLRLSFRQSNVLCSPVVYKYVDDSLEAQLAQSQYLPGPVKSLPQRSSTGKNDFCQQKHLKNLSQASLSYGQHKAKPNSNPPISTNANTSWKTIFADKAGDNCAQSLPCSLTDLSCVPSKRKPAVNVRKNVDYITKTEKHSLECKSEHNERAMLQNAVSSPSCLGKSAMTSCVYKKMKKKHHDQEQNPVKLNDADFSHMMSVGDRSAHVATPHAAQLSSIENDIGEWKKLHSGEDTLAYDLQGLSVMSASNRSAKHNMLPQKDFHILNSLSQRKGLLRGKHNCSALKQDLDTATQNSDRMTVLFGKEKYKKTEVKSEEKMYNLHTPLRLSDLYLESCDDLPSHEKPSNFLLKDVQSCDVAFLKRFEADVTSQSNPLDCSQQPPGGNLSAEIENKFGFRKSEFFVADPCNEYSWLGEPILNVGYSQNELSNTMIPPAVSDICKVNSSAKLRQPSYVEPQHDVAELDVIADFDSQLLSNESQSEIPFRLEQLNDTLKSSMDALTECTQDYLSDCADYEDITSADEDCLQCSMSSLSHDSTRLESLGMTLRLIRIHRVLKGRDHKQRVDLLLKFRLFQRWRRNARIGAQVKRAEEQKVASALLHRKGSLVNRHFWAWRFYVLKQKYKAIEFHRFQLLAIGISGWKYWVKKCKERDAWLKARRDMLTIRSVFKEWRQRYRHKLQVRLHCAFVTWRRHCVLNLTLKKLQEKQEKRKLFKCFYEWKIRLEDREVQNLSAQFHAVVLKRQALRSWIMFAANSDVHRSQDLLAARKLRARCLTKTFQRWKSATKTLSKAKAIGDRKIKKTAVRNWKRESECSKVLRRKQAAIARNLKLRNLLKSTWNIWTIELKVALKLRHWQGTCLRECFVLWKNSAVLQIVNKERAELHYGKLLRCRVIRMWKVFCQDTVQRRQLASQRLTNYRLLRIFQPWKHYVVYMTSLTTAADRFSTALAEANLRRKYLTWTAAFYARALERARHRQWSVTCVMRAAERWKRFVRKEKLKRSCEGRLIQQRKSAMRYYLLNWKTQLAILKQKQTTADTFYQLMRQRFMLVILREWRQLSHDSCFLRPFVEKRDRKLSARTFDGWRCVIAKKHLLEERAEEMMNERKKEYLSRWRREVKKRQSLGEWVLKKERDQTKRCFDCWKKFRERGENLRLVTHESSIKRVGTLFHIWASRAAQRHLEAQRRSDNKRRQREVVTECFQRWKEETRYEKILKDDSLSWFAKGHELDLKLMTFKRWKRSLINRRLADQFGESHAKSTILDILKSWHTFTQNNIRLRSQQFADSLRAKVEEPRCCFDPVSEKSTRRDLTACSDVSSFEREDLAMTQKSGGSSAAADSCESNEKLLAYDYGANQSDAESLVRGDTTSQSTIETHSHAESPPSFGLGMGSEYGSPSFRAAKAPRRHVQAPRQRSNTPLSRTLSLQATSFASQSSLVDCDHVYCNDSGVEMAKGSPSQISASREQNMFPSERSFVREDVPNESSFGADEWLSSSLTHSPVEKRPKPLNVGRWLSDSGERTGAAELNSAEHLNASAFAPPVVASEAIPPPVNVSEYGDSHHIGISRAKDGKNLFEEDHAETEGLRSEVPRSIKHEATCDGAVAQSSRSGLVELDEDASLHDYLFTCDSSFVHDHHGSKSSVRDCDSENLLDQSGIPLVPDEDQRSLNGDEPAEEFSSVHDQDDKKSSAHDAHSPTATLALDDLVNESKVSSHESYESESGANLDDVFHEESQTQESLVASSIHRSHKSHDDFVITRDRESSSLDVVSSCEDHDHIIDHSPSISVTSPSRSFINEAVSRDTFNHVNDSYRDSTRAKPNAVLLRESEPDNSFSGDVTVDDVITTKPTSVADVLICESPEKRLERLVNFAISRLMHPSLSHAFYQWKLLIHTRRWSKSTEVVVKNRIARKRLVQCFRTWKERQLAEERSRSYYKRKVLHPVLRAWIEWCLQKKHYKKCKAAAASKIGRRLLSSHFCTWKKNYKQKKSLNDILSYWKSRVSDRTLVTQHGLALEQQRDSALLQRCLTIWVEKSRQLLKCDEHYTTKVNLRCFLSWRHYSELKAEKRRRIADVNETLLKRRLLKTWQRMLVRQENVAQMHFVNMKKWLISLLRRWHVYSVGQAEREINYRVLSTHSRHTLLQRSVTIWRHKLTLRQTADSLYECNLLYKIITSWRSCVVDERLRAERMGVVTIARNNRIVSSSFKIWHQSFQLLKRATLFEGEGAKRWWRRWKKALAVRKADKTNRFFTLRRIFALWLNAHRDKKLARDKARNAIAKWRSFALKSKHLTELADRIVTSQAIIRKEIVFNEWVIASDQSQRARKNFRRKTLRKTLIGWREVTERAAQEHEKIEELLSTWNQRRLDVLWQKWRQETGVQLRRAVSLQQLRSEFDTRSLRRAWLSWKHRKDYSVATRVFQQKFTSKIFNTWKFTFYQSQVAKSFCEDRIDDLMEKVVRVWRASAASRRSEMKLVRDFRARSARNELERRFVEWKESFQLSLALKKNLEKLDKKRQFDRWRDWWLTSRDNRQNIEICLERRHRNLISNHFHTWLERHRAVSIMERRAADYAAKLKEKYLQRLWSVWVQKHNERKARVFRARRLLTRGLYSWLHFVQCEKIAAELSKRRDVTITRCLFVRWKMQTQVEAVASEQRQSSPTREVKKEEGNSVVKTVASREAVKVDGFVKRKIVGCVRKTTDKADARMFRQQRQHDVMKKAWLVWTNRTAWGVFASMHRETVILKNSWSAWRLRYVSALAEEEMTKQRHLDVEFVIFEAWRNLSSKKPVGHVVETQSRIPRLVKK